MEKKQTIYRIERIFPIRKLLGWLLIWGTLLVVYHKILYPMHKFDVPDWFPISVLHGQNLNVSGIPYAILFVILLGLTSWKIDSINDFFIGCLGCVLIIFGNLIQGNFNNAFLRPLGGPLQYYYDATHMTAWRTWLVQFNNNQSQLALHSQTHPPFAVLIQRFFLTITGNHITGVAVLLSLSSLIAVFLVTYILRCLRVEPQKRKHLLLLFSVIPAINIYSIVSLDGVILTTSILFLLGLVVVVEKPDIKWQGYFLMVVGFLATSGLTYGSLFLVGVGVLLSLYEIFVDKKWDLLIGMVITGFAFGISILILKSVFNYDHIQGFLTASRIENPDGFRLFSDPANYLFTRFEDVSEILIFLSFSVLAILFPINWRKSKNNFSFLIGMSGIFMLSLLFISGAFRTGETARACLFIYPYLLLLLIDTQPNLMKYVVFLAGAQTIFMQFAGNFFW